LKTLPFVVTNVAQSGGVYSVGCSSTWNGTCRVCGEEKRITESRDYAYFFTGIRKLKLSLKES